jgi:hypothetical protein
MAIKHHVVFLNGGTSSTLRSIDQSPAPGLIVRGSFYRYLHKVVRAQQKLLSKPITYRNSVGYSDGFPQVFDPPATRSDTGTHYNHGRVFERE